MLYSTRRAISLTIDKNIFYSRDPYEDLKEKKQLFHIFMPSLYDQFLQVQKGGNA